MELDRRLDELLSKQALHDLLARLARGQDRRDESLILSCYHPDAVDDHSHTKGDRDVFAHYIVNHMSAALGADPEHPAIQHAISNELFEIEGDTAHGETYVFLRYLRPGGEVGLGWCRYDDHFERRDGEWRILHRRVIVDHTPVIRATGAFTPGDGMTLGRHDTLDASYDRTRS